MHIAHHLRTALVVAITAFGGRQALAHECELTNLELTVDESTGKLLVVAAGSDERKADTDYEVRVVDGAGKITVKPSGKFGARDAVLQFTAHESGEALVEVKWTYEPKGGTGFCYTLVKISKPDVPATTAASQPNASDTEEPITLSTGEYWVAGEPDLALGGPFPLRFERYYASRLAADGRVMSPLGVDWMSNFDLRIEKTTDKAWVVAPRGQIVRFVRDASVWTLADPGEDAFQLVDAGSDTLFGDPRTRRVYTFGTDGTLSRIEDGRGNAHTCARTSGRITSVSDGLGRALAFLYAPDNSLTSVSDGTRTVSFGYTGGLLTAVTGADGGVESYAYDTSHQMPGLMTSLTRPRGNVPAVQVYDADGRVVRQTDALGNRTDLSYRTTKKGATTATLRDADGGKSVFPHDADGGATGWTDAAGRRVRIGYEDGRRTSAEDAAGRTTRFEYDGAGARSRVELPGGLAADVTHTAWTFRGITFREISQVRYGDGSTDAYTYDVSGNLTSWKDREDRSWTYTYLARGLLETTRSPLGGVEHRTYDPSGRLSGLMDTFAGSTTWQYDALDRPIRRTRADGSFAAYEYDVVGRLTRRTDEAGFDVRFDFDLNGNLTTFTDAVGASTSFTYDAMDRIVRTDAPLGAMSTAEYDALGRRSATTDPGGGRTLIQRDRAGRIESFGDGQGATWERMHDALGNLTEVGAPGVPSLRYQYDGAGRLSRVTGGNGSESDVLGDALGFLLGVADTNRGVTWTMHDRTGALTSFDPPGETGGAWITYDGLRHPLRLEDGRGNAWTHAYDTSGRRTESEDPLGFKTGYSYDTLGRLSAFDLPGGAKVGITYDPTGNVTKRSYDGGLDLSYSYDGVGRMTLGAGFSASYDLRGDLSACNGLQYARDADGRVTGVQYAPGKTVMYAYDARGLVTSIQDWTGGTCTLGYDAARRMTSIERPNGVMTRYTYSPDGRVTGILDQNGVVLGDQRLTRDGGGRVIDSFRDLPLLPGAAPLEGTWTFDAGCRADGFTYAPGGQLLQDDLRSYSWDAAGRLSGYMEGSRKVDFTWDGNGFPLTRAEGGTTLSFVWNYATANPSPVVVRRDGQDDAYYIRLPDGALLYRLDATTSARHFFHFDESGNVTFVTGGAAQVEGAWTYDPFGCLTGTMGTFTDLFGFGGRDGVISEPGNDLRIAGTRLFDGRMGTFLAPSGVASVASGVQLNAYQYANGDPVNFVAPTGQETEGSGFYRDFTNAGVNLASIGSFVNGLILEGTPIGQVAWYGKNTPVTPNLVNSYLGAARTYAAEARTATNAATASRALSLANEAIEEAKVAKGAAKAMSRLGEGAFALGAGLEVYDAYNKAGEVTKQAGVLFDSSYQTFSGQLDALFQARKAGRISQREYNDRVAQIRSQFDADIDNTKRSAALQTFEEGLRGFARALGSALPGPVADLFPSLR